MPLATSCDLLAALRADLTAARYTELSLRMQLGESAADAYAQEFTAPALLAARADAAAPCLRLLALFTLGEELSGAEIDSLLPTLTSAGAQELGLLSRTENGGCRALVELRPYQVHDELGEADWWLASDLREVATGKPLGPDHVMGVGGASRTLAQLTPRTPVSSAADVGTGCGVQALHLARHAKRVVATDVSPRALGFARFNAALNGLAIETRLGSLTEPLAGEEFALIVSNPPFVISPPGEDKHTYRETSHAGDSLLQELLTALPKHLTAGGNLVLLGNWEIPDNAAWDTHPRAWLSTPGLPPLVSWVVQRDALDTLSYARRWLRDGGIADTSPQLPARLSAYLTDFSSRGVSRIGFGYLFARRLTADTAATGVTCEELTGALAPRMAAHVTATLDETVRLASLSDDALLAAHCVRAQDVMERRHLLPGRPDSPLVIELVQGAGFHRTLALSPEEAALLGACDGELSVGQILAALGALLGEEDLAPRLLPTVRAWLRCGVLGLAQTADGDDS
ncbi:methyltransferase [Dermabacteraceae bacterium P13128]